MGEGKGRILVVEDDPDAALFAIHVLANRASFEVIHTADPWEALALAAAQRWDLVLTDVEMPGMSGLELLDALRRVAPALPFAVLSAHVCPPDLLARAEVFLSKPVRIDQLISTATTLIGRTRRTGQ